MMAIVSGVVCIAAGLARLGFITELLSKPIRYGYMNGIALTVVLSQIPKLFGFSVSADGPLRQAWGIVEQVMAGSTNLVALAVGASTLALILILKRRPRVPGMLIAVTAATVAVAVLDLATRFGISVLGPLPQGLPTPRLPIGDVDSLVPVLTGGVAVALVSFADTSVLSRTYAARLRTPVDPEPGDGGPRRRQPRGRLLPGLSDQQQLVAHPGGRGGGRQDPADRCRGRARHLRVAAGRARPAQGSAQHGARGRRHRVGDRPVRSVRPAPALSHSALGVLAVDGLLRRAWRRSAPFRASSSRS